MNRDKGTLPSIYFPLIEVDKAKIRGGVNNTNCVNNPSSDEARSPVYKTKSYESPSTTADEDCGIAFETSSAI